jgi:ankyrin repeat protein
MTAKHPKRKDRPGVDRAGRTELHYAARDNDSAAMRRLLAQGSNPSAADDEGWTPLHFAAHENAAEATRLLLEAGATVDVRDAHGNTPLWRAVWSSRGNGEVIRLLRLSGADPRAENHRGGSPLKLARTISNFNVRQFFSDLPEDSDIDADSPTDPPRD